jgi:hypothetical protein
MPEVMKGGSDQARTSKGSRKDHDHSLPTCPFILLRKSRKQSARDVATQASTSGRDGEEESDVNTFPQCGDVVEYPLSEAARVRMDDGREKGVGFIVGRNIGEPPGTFA